MAVDPVGLTGLIIALVALLLASLQMMQALFATADGYRNCRPAIMGDWGDSKLTRRKFVPGEMRFETIYTVPYISMRPGLDRNLYIDGTGISRMNTHCKERSSKWWRQRHATSEMVTWVFLLDQLHNLGAVYERSLETTCALGSLEPNQRARENIDNMAFWYNPHLTVKERSWDFTPSDVNKPLAVSNLASIAIIVRRLGMTWTMFQPSSSLLQAEGNDMVVNSVKIPAVGTVLDFSRVERKVYGMGVAEVYIPTPPADALGFGIIQPWYPSQNHLKVGTSEEFIETLLVISDGGPATQKVRERIKAAQLILGLADVVGLTAQLMYARGTLINRVPQPSSVAGGILVSNDASKVFRERLLTYISDHEPDIFEADLKHLRWIQNSWDNLERLGAWREEDSPSLGFTERTDLLNHLYETLIIAEPWLNFESKVYYPQLLGYHVRLVVSCEDGINEALRENRQRPLPAYATDFAGNGRECESMHFYVDYVENEDNWTDVLKTPGRLRDGRHKPLPSEKSVKQPEELSVKRKHSLIVVAWFTMIFRGLCWYRLHRMVPGPVVGSQYWKSQQSVYIT